MSGGPAPDRSPFALWLDGTARSILFWGDAATLGALVFAVLLLCVFIIRHRQKKWPRDQLLPLVLDLLGIPSGVSIACVLVFTWPPAVDLVSRSALAGAGIVATVVLLGRSAAGLYDKLK